MLDKPESCSGCSFKSRGIGFVPPSGPPDSKLRIIGEAPGAEEVSAGIPFVGKSGKLLRIALKQAKLLKERCHCVKEKIHIEKADSSGCPDCLGLAWKANDIYIANTIQCRPPGNDYNLVPSDAVAYCRAAHISEAQPGSVTFLVGGKALQSEFPSLNSIERWRGSVLPLGVRVYIPTLHPSFILRGKRKYLPLLAVDIANGSKYQGFIPPKIVETVEPGPTVAIDVEGGKNQVDLVGITSDGIGVEHIEPTLSGYRRLQSLLDQSTTIFAHNAKFDCQDMLERVGIHIDRSKLIDTLIAQALYQSDLEKGLDDALSITLSGQWTYHKSIYGDYGGRDKDRVAVRSIWARWIPEIESMNEGQLYRIYNCLDTAGCWRLGVRLKEVFS